MATVRAWRHCTLTGPMLVVGCACIFQRSTCPGTGTPTTTPLPVPLLREPSIFFFACTFVTKFSFVSVKQAVLRKADLTTYVCIPIAASPVLLYAIKTKKSNRISEAGCHLRSRAGARRRAWQWRLWALMTQLVQPRGFELQIFRLALQRAPKSGEVWCRRAFKRLRCLHADRNYGKLWFHCKQHPYDTAKQILAQLVRSSSLSCANISGPTAGRSNSEGRWKLQGSILQTDQMVGVHAANCIVSNMVIAMKVKMPPRRHRTTYPKTRQLQ